MSYQLNDKSEFYWEIVAPDGYVHEYIQKTCDDDNRDEAETRLKELNALARRRIARPSPRRAARGQQ